jgi:NADPH-dependent ferric siderophore reductase
MSKHVTRVTCIMDHFLLHGTVDDVEDVTRRMRRIRIVGESLRGMDWVAGRHVRVRVEGLVLRTYSVWDYDDDGTLDLCVLDHPGAGPGARWSRQVRAGQQVTFTRPDGRLVLRTDAPYHLFVGDETASVAFGAMLRVLPAAARVYGVIGVDDLDHRLSLPRAGELTWVSGDALVPALEALDLPGEPGVAYVAGEARACQAVRRHLTRERGWSRGAVVVKPFWTPGKRGMD